jgi:5'(3')-deoxyribonucleotidase
MSGSEFVFGIDLDGVVADFVSGLKPIAAEWRGIATSELTDQVSYGLAEWHLGGKRGYEALHRYAVKERQLFRSLPLIAGAAPTIRRLSTRGIRIRIITHRLYIPWFHREAITQTVEWLDKHGIPYWDLCFMAEKSSVDADAYVEDSPANIEMLRASGKNAIVLRNSTNLHVDEPGAANWGEVEAWVLQQATRDRRKKKVHE